MGYDAEDFSGFLFSSVTCRDFLNVIFDGDDVLISSEELEDAEPGKEARSSIH